MKSTLTWALSGLLSLFLVKAAFAAPAAGELALADPVKWIAVDAGMKVELLQDIDFGLIQLQRAGTYAVTEVTPLEMIQVTEILLQATTCGAPDAEAEMTLVKPETAPEGAEVGVEYRKGCGVAIYLQTKDLESPSFFAPKP